MKIAILGAGVYGTALGGVLEEKGYIVDYYDPFLSDKTLPDVLDGAEMILMVAPSDAVESLIKELPKNLPLIVATKGIMDDRIFNEFNDLMILSGPGFADDIKAHKLTHLTITDDRLKEMFGVDYIRFDETSDVRGVLMCGALKNVYAILAGYLGLDKDYARRDSFVDDVAHEMGLVLSANGAQAETAELYCGRDDLILSCSDKSRNFEFGMKLRLNNNYRPEKTVEGFAALRRIKQGEIMVPDSAKYLKELMGLI